MDQHVQQTPITVLELHFHAVLVRALRNDVAMHQMKLIGPIRRPVGQRGRFADQFKRAVTHQTAKGFVDVQNLAAAVPGAQTDGHRVFHRRTQSHLGRKQALHLLALDKVAPQCPQADQHARQEQQRHKKEDARHGGRLHAHRCHAQEQVSARQVQRSTVGLVAR